MTNPKVTRRQQLLADQSLLLSTILAASAFVVVKNGMATVEPLTFLALRFSLASGLLILLFWRRLSAIRPRELVAGGTIGLILFVGFSLQALGLQESTASKAGFVTNLSVVIVPFLAWALLRHVPSPLAGIGVALAAAGLALLCLNDDWTLGYGDMLLLGCAMSFAVQIVLISKYAPRIDFVALATMQVVVVAVGSGVAALILEGVPTGLPLDTTMAIVYTGVAATVVTNLIQTRAQAFTSATRAGLMYAAAPVFAAIFACFGAGETLTSKGVSGCGLMLLGIVMSELRPPMWSKSRSQSEAPHEQFPLAEPPSDDCALGESSRTDGTGMATGHGGVL